MAEPIDPREFRRALGAFATGVTVVTARGPGGETVGFTANSFTAVSLDPPLVLFCIDRAASCFATIEAASGFVVNVLADDQQALSVRFAEPHADRFVGIPTSDGPDGAKIVAGCLATLECRVEARHPGGDHVIVVGRVLRLAARRDGRPLLFFRGAYGRV